MNHTPTPWELEGGNIVWAKNKILAYLCLENGKKNAKANAEFIVRACNAWDNVEALEVRIKELKTVKNER